MTIGAHDMQVAGPVADGLDIASFRAATAGTRDRHYLNAAGSALVSDAVAVCVRAHLDVERRIGGYEAARAAADDVEGVYQVAAELLGVDASGIAFFDTATTGLRVLFDALRLGKGDTVIASRSTYVSQALRLMTMEREDGVRLVVVPNDASGSIDLDALDAALASATGRTVLSIAHIPTSSGVVEPVAAIGELARRHGALYTLDATQSVGQVVVDADAIGCHALITTGRKFLRGPRGTALGWFSPELLGGLSDWAPDVRGTSWDDQHSWTRSSGARFLETWEHAVAERLGLGVAIREAVASDLTRVESHLGAYAARLRTALTEVPGVVVTDQPAATSAIVTFTIAGWSASDAVAALREAKVDSAVVPATHGQWDLGERGIEAIVRVAPHIYNDESDAVALLDRVAEIARIGARR